MARFKTLHGEDAANAVNKIEGLEAVIVDGQLMAVIAGPLRIYANKDKLIVSEQEDT